MTGANWYLRVWIKIRLGMRTRHAIAKFTYGAVHIGNACCARRVLDRTAAHCLSRRQPPDTSHFLSWDDYKWSTSISVAHGMYRSAFPISFFESQWSLYLPTGLTFNNSTVSPHSVFMCFVWIWEQTAIISLYSINWLVFITETGSVYCAVRTGCLSPRRSGFDPRSVLWDLWWTWWH